MRSKRFITGLFIFSLCLMFSNTTRALPTAEQYGKIINIAGRQRMLTQKMTKQAAEISLGINASRNRLIMRSDLNLFDSALKSLVSGNPENGMPAAEGADIIAQLDKVKEIWQQFRKPIQTIIDGAVLDKAALKQADEIGLTLLKESNQAVKLFVEQSKQVMGDGKSSFATAVNLAGRQRMLSQKMTKEFLLIALGVDDTGNRSKLSATYQLFDKTHLGLKSGDEELGLVKSDNPKIAGFLSKVDRVWQHFLPRMESVSQGSKPLQEDLNIVANYNLQLLINCNEAVKLYEKESTN